jgi:DNA invertase Pin-like site-specific DNA recombinase
MTRARNPTPEADMAALKSAADRARAALACAFSSSAEFEADLIRERRAKGAYRAAPRRRCVVGIAILTALLVVAFLLL